MLRANGGGHAEAKGDLPVAPTLFLQINSLGRKSGAVQTQTRSGKGRSKSWSSESLRLDLVPRQFRASAASPEGGVVWKGRKKPRIRYVSRIVVGIGQVARHVFFRSDILLILGEPITIRYDYYLNTGIYIIFSQIEI